MSLTVPDLGLAAAYAGFAAAVGLDGRPGPVTRDLTIWLFPVIDAGTGPRAP